MAWVPAKMMRRWRQRNLVGEARHSAVVRVRKGHMNHLYQEAVKLDGVPIVPPLIWKGQNISPWQGQWVVDGDWVTLPNIQSIRWGRSYSENGVSTLTLVMDNVAFTEQEGVAGLYHDISRGYFSPLRGVEVASRPSLWESNAWTNRLNGGYQIDVWEGYGTDEEVQPGGDSVSRTWTGLIEDVELESHPDHITVTARDFGLLFTDQRLMGWNKAHEIRAPVTFADRKQTQGETKVVGKGAVSDGTFTISDKHGLVWQPPSFEDADHVEWCEITVRGGHFEEFFLDLAADGCEMYLSIKPNGGWYQDSIPFVEGTNLTDGWVDFGDGVVPGTTVPFVRHWKTVSGWPRRWELGERYDWGDDSVIRLWFTKMGKLKLAGNPLPGTTLPVAYSCQVDSFFAYRFNSKIPTAPGLTPKEAREAHKHWILVEDAADVVRIIMLWAGFKEFYVEDFGWTLHRPLQFGEDKFLVDIIAEILKQGNFVFYMAPPSNDDMSLGVPRFERQSAVDAAPRDMLTVKDTDMTQAVQAKWDMSNLPYVIRYRGVISKKGNALDGDLSKRFMATYYPPWAAQHYFALGNWEGGDRYGSYGPFFDRVAGVRRQFSQTMGDAKSSGLNSDAECLFACLLAAVQYALQMATGEVEFAGMPLNNLNDHIGVIEEATGINSRLWIASIESEHTLGPNGKWTMKYGGSFVDGVDMYLIGDDYRYAYRKLVKERPPGGERHIAAPPNPGPRG